MSLPEIVVGIDFGMTCTGVAYSMGPEWPPPTTIQHWPGKLGHEIRNKVETVIAYDPETGHPESWGFLVDKEREDLDIEELFKLWLDPTYADDTREEPVVNDARRWFTDYMRCVYDAVQAHFDDSSPRWRSKQVEFLFSVPTTWKNPAMIAEIEKLIKRAGFGERPNQIVKISLTEAEAAAVYVSKQSYEKGDVFLVCDAGGGTTDINILKVKNATSSHTELEPLSWVQGEAIGSTLINFKVEKLLRERLALITEHLDDEPEKLAWKMMSTDRFEVFKCSFGSAAQNVLDLMLPVPGMEPGQEYAEAHIRDSKMVVTKEELQAVFDEMIDKMFRLVDGEIRKLQHTSPGESISYLVLSGGFGSSPYLKQRMRRRYELGDNSDLFNARAMKLLVAKEPQLVVTHGLVLDRIQELKSAIGVYAERCCRNSYGIIVRQLYDPIRHLGEEVSVDPRDKKKWAERQINWFIKQGQKVSVREGIKNQYRIKFDADKEKLPWKTHIVMSSIPADQLPRSMKHEGVKPVCQVESAIGEGSMKLKNRHWYNFRQSYWRADFEVRILIGPADMQFQIFDKNGQISKTHEEIEVLWDPPQRKGLVPFVAEREVFGIYQA